jgi:hypothetical protein
MNELVSARPEQPPSSAVRFRENMRAVLRLILDFALPPLCPSCREPPQQVGRSKTERAENVQGAFVVPGEQRAEIAGWRLIVVDDVLTSGATVDACTRALLRAGASHVDVLVFARVVARAHTPI